MVQYVWKWVHCIRSTPKHNFRYQGTNNREFQSAVNEVMSERENIHQRRLNLILHNVPESRETDDMGTLNTIIREKLDITENISITAVTRIGAIRPDKQRILRISLETLTGKRRVLQSATKLRNLDDADRYAKVFIRPNLTPKQQEESKNLYGLLKRTREEDPNNTYKIRRGQIIKVDPVAN